MNVRSEVIAAPARLLLDTRVFLWWQAGSRMLVSDTAHQIAVSTDVHLSVVTAWELAIKASSGKLQLRESFAAAVDANRFGLLPITLEHVEAVGALPRTLRPRDPFDRMLIAQVIHEGLTLVTHDRAFGDYPVPVLWA